VPVGNILHRIRDRIDPVHARGMRVSVRFDLAGMDRWRIAIADGQVTAGPSEEFADCVIETNGETLQAILDGEQNVRTAYISGKVKVHGDLALARWLIAA
jgi:putative sterol carrier protein